MSFRHLIRMSRWARNPPSEKMVIFVFSVIAICFVLFAIERWIGWPDWLVPNNMGRTRF
ncbi:hypothetical protein PH7735_01544 [Shimia thalassica]|uniref:Uncharacterized protein n=1 Tax=Shimia thalassica TaxID=1715693 RepID=A0A0P1I660_9RHOB|nr:hypothetical protein PH7735_01544 [Shimia thalassica]